ncbi:hypothetical protein EVA_03179 [gut metagenome]|uniref:HPr kinase n=1 Tax=gut metagenome TaxID=749906 RepID=J9GZL8_9ZZZZ
MTNNMTPNYCIAGQLIRIESEALGEALARTDGFAPFATPATDEPACTLRLADTELPAFDRVLHESYECQTRIEYGTAGTGFAVRVKHDGGSETDAWMDLTTHTGHLCTDGDPYCLKMALWFVFGTLTVDRGCIAIHSSTICWNRRCVLFLGESGTGKSTHTKLWLKHIAGAHLLNDDSPVLRVLPDGAVWVYGSPWSGKTPCYRNEAYPVAGLVRLSQAPENRIRRLPVVQAFGALHPSCPPDFALDDRLYDPLCDTLNGVLLGAPVFHLACLPDEAAARLSHTTVFGTEAETEAGTKDGNGTKVENGTEAGNGTEANVMPEEPCGK